MPQDLSEQDLDDPDAEFEELDPTGRYGRYKEILGKGAFKKVYRAFDGLEGIEVAWNQVKVADLLRNNDDLERLYSEVHLLKTLKHKNIIKLFNSWVDTKNENINFITEIFTSGTLRQYRKKHKHVDLRALKKWSKQILEGLSYLHSHDPPIIHRDLKCDNIFVNGNHGEVKIGDLGLAAILQQASSAHSVIGTPEFMAPELYEEEYNELVDVYAFGMCLLELVTVEYPYIECANAAQIYKKVTSGIKPASLAKVADPGVKAFIEKCIANVSKRLSAKELLMDPFLQPVGSDDIGRSLIPQTHDLDIGHSSHHAIGEYAQENSAETGREFRVEGQRRDINTIFLKLRIVDLTGHIHNIHFPFDIEADTAISVAREMVEELELTDQDVTTIARMIDLEIQYLFPDWNPNATPLADRVGQELAPLSDVHTEIRDEASPGGMNTSASIATLSMERLPSGRNYWIDSPRTGRNSPLLPGAPKLINEMNADEGSITANGATSVEQQAGNYIIDGDFIVEKEFSGITDSHSSWRSIMSGDLQATDGESSLIEKPVILNDTESEYVSIMVAKLEKLLVKQQEELDELKRKHESAVSGLLKELHPEIRHRVVNICHLEISDSENVQ